MHSLPQQPVAMFECGGAPYEMGVAQGDRLRDNIQEAVQKIERMEAVRMMKPAWLPLGLFVQFGGRRAVRFLSQAFDNVSVAAAERLRGIADGAGVPYRSLAFCNSLEAALSDLTASTFVPPDAACSAVAVTRSASHNGAPILAHNFDYLPLLQPHYLIRRSAPAGGLRSVELSVSLAPGAVSGINEAGLSITCNYAHATDTSSPAPTITMLIAEALASLQTVHQTVEFFQRTPRTGGGLLMLGDPSGEIASLEISNGQVVRRNPQDDRLAHSNRYCCAPMRQVEVDEQATYGKNHALNGRRVHQSSEERDAALGRRLTETTNFDPDTLQSVMSDHGPDDTPSGDTVCMHGEYWHTTASLQVLPSQRVLRASFSPTCIARYEEFSVIGARNK